MDPGAMPLMQAISIIQKEAGSYFALEVVSAFLRCLPGALRLYRGSHFAPEYVDEASAAWRRSNITTPPR